MTETHSRSVTDPGPSGESVATKSGKLSLSVKLAYGLPSFAGLGMEVPIGIFLTKFYADTIGVAVGFIALAQVLARALDAITDPLMGWLSDRTRTRWGRRRPYILVGTPLAAVAAIALFGPPDGITPLMGAAWFTTTFMAYFFFQTVYSIPHYGLGPELTDDYHERSGLFAWRDGLSLAGQLFASVSPAFLMSYLQTQGHDQASSERTVLMWLAVSMSLMLVISYYWMCLRIQENPEFSARAPNPIVPGVRHVLRNRPFRILLICTFVSYLTRGGVGMMMPFYMQYALGIQDWLSWMGIALLFGYGAGIVTLPGFVWLARRFGKKPVWIAGFVLGFICQVSLTALPSFVQGDAAAWIVMGLFMLGGIAGSTSQFLDPSLQADAIDYDELYTGKRREAQYGSFWFIVRKFSIIPSLAVPLAVLATLGYEPNVEQSESVRWAIRLLYAGIPGVMGLVAMLVAMRYPIDEAVHAATLAGIAAHKRGETALDPITGRAIAPPQDRGLDEDTGWYLDHFSSGELERMLHAGSDRARALRRSTWLALGVSVVCFIAAGVGIGLLFDLNQEPGVGVLSLVLLAGLSLSASGFHAVRARAARDADGIAPERIQTHLEITKRLAHAGNTS